MSGRQAVAALHHRQFALFWTGALISNIGSWMQMVTVPYVVFQLTRSAGWVGLAAFAGLFPALLLAPLAGSLADRFNRRVMLIWSQAAQGLLAMALWGVWVGHWRSPTLLIGIIAVAGAVAGASMPAWQAFVTELVPREDLLNAITLNSAQFNAARALGPAIGGLVLGRFGPSWAFLMNALSFLAVIAALSALRVPALARTASKQRVLEQFGEGIRYARRHTGILVALGLCAALSFLGTPVFQMAPVLAKRVYHVGPGLYGVLIAAFGTAAVAGAGVLGVLGARVPASRIVVSGIVLYAGGLTLLGLTGTYAVGVSGMALCGMAFPTVMATLNTTVQLQVAEAVRGRVLALWMVGITGSYPLGALLQGWLADRVGPRATLLGAGAVLAVVITVVVARPGLVTTLDGHVHRTAGDVPTVGDIEIRVT